MVSAILWWGWGRGALGYMFVCLFCCCFGFCVFFLFVCCCVFCLFVCFGELLVLFVYVLEGGVCFFGGCIVYFVWMVVVCFRSHF